MEFKKSRTTVQREVYNGKFYIVKQAYLSKIVDLISPFIENARSTESEEATFILPRYFHHCSQATLARLSIDSRKK